MNMNFELNMNSNKLKILATIVAVCLLTIFALTALKWPGSFYAYGFMTFAFLGVVGGWYTPS